MRRRVYHIVPCVWLAILAATVIVAYLSTNPHPSSGQSASHEQEVNSVSIAIYTSENQEVHEMKASHPREHDDDSGFDQKLQKKSKDDSTKPDLCQQKVDPSKAIQLTENQQIPDHSIFFFGTAAKPFLNPIQLCIIESAALHNPKRPIIVTLNTTLLINSPGVTQLQKTYRNIHINSLNLKSWVSGTVLENWLGNRLLETGRFPVAHTSDLLRCVSLFKYGGIYLDLDVMTLKNLDKFTNSVGFEEVHKYIVGNAVLAFEKEHPVMAACLEGVLTDYKNQDWFSIGPGLIGKLMRWWCHLKLNQTLEPGICNGVSVLTHDVIYQPLGRINKQFLYYENPPGAHEFMRRLQRSLTVHLWNSESFKWPVRVNSSQIVAQLAKKHCPVVNSLHDTFYGCDVHHF